MDEMIGHIAVDHDRYVLTPRPPPREMCVWIFVVGPKTSKQMTECLVELGVINCHKISQSLVYRSRRTLNCWIGYLLSLASIPLERQTGVCVFSSRSQQGSSTIASHDIRRARSQNFPVEI